MRFLKNPIIRWLMTILLLGLLGFQLWSRSHHFANLSLMRFDKNMWWFALVLVIMPVNWMLETIKWRMLLRPHLQASFLKILKAVAGGVALSIFTPNRIGEYGGRIMFMPAKSKWPVAISTWVGSLAQNLVAFSLGIFSCLFLFDLVNVLKISGIVAITLALFCFFNLRNVITRISTLNIHPFIKKLVQNLRYMDAYSPTLLWKVLGLAVMRYAVYVTQFVLILHAFEPDVQLRIMFLGVSAIFLFQTLVPLPPITDIMARANIGLMIWAGSGMSELSISLASLMIWLINLLIPAMIGSFAIGTTVPKNSLDTNEPIIPSAYFPVTVESSEAN